MKLDGLIVLDLSQFLPGPQLTLMMSDHGADVVKIEAPGGEPARRAAYRTGDASVWFRNTHRGKRSVVLDLRSAQGRDAFLALASDADVIVEGFRPGTVEKFGIDYDAVAALNPSIVYASISAFGQTGPLSARPAHNAAVEAYAGTLSLGSDERGRPLMPHLPAADIAASLTALSGIMMALYRREKTGCGEYLDISMHDAVQAWLSYCVGPVFAEGRAPVLSHELQWGGYAFNRVYVTREGRYIVLAGIEEKFVRNLLGMLGRDDLVHAALTPPPSHDQESVITFLESAFAQRTRDEWEALLGQEDVAFGPVLDLHEAFSRSQARDRGMVVRDAEGNLHIGNPIRMRAEPAQLDFSVPRLGQHTEEVLARIESGHMSRR